MGYADFNQYTRELYSYVLMANLIIMLYAFMFGEEKWRNNKNKISTFQNPRATQDDSRMHSDLLYMNGF